MSLVTLKLTLCLKDTTTASSDSYSRTIWLFMLSSNKVNSRYLGNTVRTGRVLIFHQHIVADEHSNQEVSSLCIIALGVWVLLLLLLCVWFGLFFPMNFPHQLKAYLAYTMLLGMKFHSKTTHCHKLHPSVCAESITHEPKQCILTNLSVFSF